MKKAISALLILLLLAPSGTLAASDDTSPPTVEQITSAFSEDVENGLLFGTKEIDGWVVSLYDNDGMICIVSLWDGKDTWLAEVIDFQTGELILPTGYRLYFASDNKLFGIVGERTEAMYFEIDYSGNILALDRSMFPDDAWVTNVDKAGSVSLCMEGYSEDAPYLMALYDSEYHRLTDFIFDADYEGSLNFIDGMATVTVDGREGVIDRSGKFLIEPIYTLVAQLPSAKFAVTFDKRNYDIVNAYDGSVFLYDYLHTSDWAKPEYDRAIKLGLIEGYDSGYSRFRSYNATRQEFCQFAVYLYQALYGEQPMPENLTPFEDVDEGFLLVDYVAHAYALGLIKGRTETMLDPLADITREEAAIMLFRLANLLGITPNADALEFDDVGSVIPEAQSAIAAVSAMVDYTTGYRVMNGVGDGSFEPKEPYTVEQAICTMLRLYNVASADSSSSLASQFLDENKDELVHIVNVIHTAMMRTEEFSKPSDISEFDLFNFYVFNSDGTDVSIDNYYDSITRLTRIPTTSITKILDPYFDNYDFDFSALFGGSAYDANSNEVVVSGYGALYDFAFEISDTVIISDDEIELYIDYFDPTQYPDVKEHQQTRVLTLKVYGTDYKFVSFIIMEN